MVPTLGHLAALECSVEHSRAVVVTPLTLDSCWSSAEVAPVLEDTWEAAEEHDRP